MMLGYRMGFMNNKGTKHTFPCAISTTIHPGYGGAKDAPELWRPA